MVAGRAKLIYLFWMSKVGFDSDGCCKLHCEVPSPARGCVFCRWSVGLKEVFKESLTGGTSLACAAFKTRGSAHISSPRAEVRRDLEQRLLDVNSKTQHLLADQREDFDARLAQVPSGDGMVMEWADSMCHSHRCAFGFMIVYDSPQHELHRPSLPQCWLSKPGFLLAPRCSAKGMSWEENWSSRTLDLTWKSPGDSDGPTRFFSGAPPIHENQESLGGPVLIFQPTHLVASNPGCKLFQWVTPVRPGQSGAIGFPSQLQLSLVGFKWKPSGNHWIIAESDVTFSLEQLPKEMSDLFVALLCNKPMRSTLASRIEKRNSSTETSLEDLKHQLEILSAQQQSVPESESGTGGVGVRSISQEVRGTWCPQLYFRHLIQLRILKTFKT